MPVDTQRRFNVYKTSIRRGRRGNNVVCLRIKKYNTIIYRSLVKSITFDIAREKRGRERVFRLVYNDHATFENSFEKWISDYLSKIYSASLYKRFCLTKRKWERQKRVLRRFCHVEILSWKRSRGDFAATHENILRNPQISLKYTELKYERQ